MASHDLRRNGADRMAVAAVQLGGRRPTKIAAWGVLAVLLIPAFVIRSETPDWPAWIVGARLHGDAARLYSFEESLKITRTFAEPRDGVWAFVRPPVYASLLRPLAWVSVRHAFVAWQILNVAAAGTAAWLLWPSAWTPVLVVVFPPLLTSFKQGQDIPLFLLALAVSAKLMGRRPFLAGLVLALLGLKVQLLLLMPVFFVARKSWKMAGGFLAGGVVLIASCFALYGSAWVSLYFRFVLENQKLLDKTGWIESFGPLWVGVLVVAAGGTAILMRRIGDDETALFVAMGISLIPAPHLYSYDFVLALPVYLLLVRGLRERLASRREVAGATARVGCLRDA